MFDFVGKKYIFFGLSLAIMLAGIIGYIVNGLNMDIQFKGGTIIEMKMKDANFNEVEAGEMISKLLDRSVIPQKSKTYNPQDASKAVDILSLNISKTDSALSSQQITDVENAIIQKYNLDSKDAVASEVNVEPLIGKEVSDNGIKALLVLSVLIVIYVAARFKVMSGLSAGVMAVIALLHDAAIMLSVYTIFKIPVNELFIAAVLTIIGYSMNDTVIIYDRIRENSNQLRKTSVAELVNKSITQTLSRSINTVVTVLICITTVFVFGKVNNIKSLADFSLPLIIGIASGCYSSIFIASPLWAMWRQSKSKKRVSGKPAKAQ